MGDREREDGPESTPTTRSDRIVRRAAEEIAARDALSANELGFSSTLLVTTTLPHTNQDRAYSATVPWCRLEVAPSRFGVLHGGVGRMLVLMVQTVVVQKQTRIVRLGRSLTDAARFLHLDTDRRTLARLASQLAAAFSSRMSAVVAPKGSGIDFTSLDDDDPLLTAGHWIQLDIAAGGRLNFDPSRPDQLELWEPEVHVGEMWYHHLVHEEGAFPFDWRAARSLLRSPLGMDLYLWLAYKAPSVHGEQMFTWRSLLDQFGAGYCTQGTPQQIRDGRKNFGRKVRGLLDKVRELYPGCNVEPVRGGLVVKKSDPHVPRAPMVVVVSDLPRSSSADPTLPADRRALPSGAIGRK